MLDAKKWTARMKIRRAAFGYWRVRFPSVHRYNNAYTSVPKPNSKWTRAKAIMYKYIQSNSIWFPLAIDVLYKHSNRNASTGQRYISNQTPNTKCKMKALPTSSAFYSFDAVLIRYTHTHTCLSHGKFRIGDLPEQYDFHRTFSLECMAKMIFGWKVKVNT